MRLKLWLHKFIYFQRKSLRILAGRIPDIKNFLGTRSNQSLRWKFFTNSHALKNCLIFKRSWRLPEYFRNCNYCFYKHYSEISLNLIVVYDDFNFLNYFLWTLNSKFQPIRCCLRPKFKFINKRFETKKSRGWGQRGDNV